MFQRKPSGISQPVSSIRVTHPHNAHALKCRSILPDKQSVAGNPDAAQQNSVRKHDKRGRVSKLVKSSGHILEFHLVSPNRFGKTLFGDDCRELTLTRTWTSRLSAASSPPRMTPDLCWGSDETTRQ
jgi:hypothetical protein